MRKLIVFIIITIIFQLSTINELHAQWADGGYKLSTGTGAQHRPTIAAMQDGSVYVTWLGNVPGTTTNFGNVCLIAIDDSGKPLPGWYQGGITMTTSGTCWAEEMICSEDTGAIVVWQAYPSAKERQRIYTMKYSKAGLPLWNGGVPFTISASVINHDQYPRLVSDRHKGFYVAWNRYDSVIGLNSTDIYLQHIDSTGNIAAGWNTNGTGVASTEGLRECYPQLALSDDGKSVYVIYSEGILGSSFKLNLKKINTSDGKPASDFPLDGVLLSNGPVSMAIRNEQFVFTDNKNNAIIFWTQAKSTLNGEIYVQKVSPTGTVLLKSGGKYLIGSTTNEMGMNYLEAVKDKDGNFLLTYIDYENNDDVGALKVSPDANIVWQKAPVTTNGYSSTPKPVSDGHKGMFIFYRNAVTSHNFLNCSLNAVALDSLGRIYNNWTLPGPYFGGINRYDGVRFDYDFTAAANKPGQSIVTWNVFGNNMTNYTVFACNLLANGLNCTDPLNSIPELISNSDLNVYPNPFTTNIFISPNSELRTLNFLLYDITGKLIINQQLNNSINQQSISVNNLPNSFYFYSIQSNNKILKKGILVKQ